MACYILDLPQYVLRPLLKTTQLHRDVYSNQSLWDLSPSLFLELDQKKWRIIMNPYLTSEFPIFSLKTSMNLMRTKERQHSFIKNHLQNTFIV